MKTIFFALSVTAVHRNLIFFPGSVVDRLRKMLKERSDLRVVFIVPKKDHQKYQDLLRDDLNDRCILESVSISPPSTFIQKLFYFFYSYFIYTGTTRQLATLGLRPEEPPAGGFIRRYLAPFKWLISRTFGRSRFMRDRLVPGLYHRVFSDRPFAALVDAYKPDAVFVSHIYGRLDTELLAECARRGTRTVGMISGWDHFDKYYLPFKVRTLLVQTEQVKDFAVRFQEYDPSIITIVGHPYFDFIADPRYARLRGDILESMGFPLDAKYLLYISGSTYCPDEPDIIETMLKWADEKRFGADMRLVVRPYQGGRAKDKEFDEEKYNRFEEHPRTFFYRKEFWGDIEKSAYFMNIMRHADAVVAIYSTAMIEAAVLDRPLIGIGFDGYHKRPLRKSINRFAMREHFKDVMASGGVTMAHSFDELAATIDKYFKNSHADAEGRERLRARVCWKLDGKSSERIIDAILLSIV